MTSFEKIAPFLVAALVLATAVVIYLCARVELRLSARKKIKLANYREKNNLFYISRDLVTTIVAGGVTLLTLVMLVVCVIKPLLRLYVIALVLLLPVEATVVFLSLTRGKCSRDIRVFDAYYMQVEDMLRNKDRTLSDIGICRNRVADLRKRLDQMVAGFNRNLAEGVSETFVTDLFAPVDQMIGEYQAEVERFSVEVEHDFDETLAKFLRDNEQPALHVVPLRVFDEAMVNDLLGQIKSSYGDKIAGMVVEQVDRGAVPDARALANIMNLLHDLDVTIDEATLRRFLAAAAGFRDRGALMKLLYRNKQIPVTTVREIFIRENWVWAFTEGMTTAFGRRDLTAILSDVLTADARDMCYRLLAQFGKRDLDVLDEALAAERARTGSADNASTQLAVSYRLIISASFAVGGSGNIAENFALMLYDRRTELGFTEEEQARIAELYTNEAYYENRAEINALYEKGAAACAPMAASATRVLLTFLASSVGGDKILRADRLAALLCEYRFTLSLGDLSTMRTLLAALVLRYDPDRNAAATVLRELAALPAGPALPANPTPDAAVQIGAFLLGSIGEHDRVRLRSVIYRTESARCALDVIVAGREVK